jgi:hypothetical protein
MHKNTLFNNIRRVIKSRLVTNIMKRGKLSIVYLERDQLDLMIRLSFLINMKLWNKYNNRLSLISLWLIKINRIQLRRVKEVVKRE